MRYLITGGAGFIGSHLAEAVLSQGHEVLVLDDFSTGRYENIKHLEKDSRFTLVRGSILDTELAIDCVGRVDRVYHLASSVGVQLIVDEPIKTIRTIVDGTASILDACSRLNKPILFTSTSEIYGKGESIPFSEDDNSIIGPSTSSRWSYATAKYLDEFLALAHHRKSGLPVVIVRLFNTIGPRQTGQYGMVVPRFITQALQNQPITIYGNGSQTRCFCHVNDVIWAIMQMLDTPEAYGEIFNIGSDTEVSINTLANTILSKTKSTSKICHISYEKAYGESFEDMGRRVPDLTKIRKLIGYSPRYTFHKTLDDTIRHLSSET